MQLIEDNLVEQTSEYKVWLFQLNDITYDESLISYLSKDEKNYLQKIKLEGRKKIYVLQKVLLRLTLQKELGTNEKLQYIEIVRETKHKPVLVSKSIRFNISHSAQFYFIGISKNYEIGVDIQRRREPIYPYPISILSQGEQSYFQKITDPQRRLEVFLRIFTVKEAFSKALGEGICLNFNQVNLFPKVLENEFEDIVDVQDYKNVKYQCKICSTSQYLSSIVIIKSVK